MVDISDSSFNMEEQRSELTSSLWEKTLEDYREDPTAKEYLPTIRMVCFYFYSQSRTSIPLLNALQMAPGTDDTLQEVSKMLEEISRTLQRLEKNERAVSMDPEMEATICTVYQGVIGFYVRAHHFFRAHEQCKFLPMML